MCVNQPDFLRIVLFTNEADFTRNGVFNTHIQQHKSAQQFLHGFGTIYIEEQRRVLENTADILNNVSNCRYVRYLSFSYCFCFDFSFHLVFNFLLLKSYTFLRLCI
jgi:hypothetical protein